MLKILTKLKIIYKVNKTKKHVPNYLAAQ